jgi:hypothetical protein
MKRRFTIWALTALTTGRCRASEIYPTLPRYGTDRVKARIVTFEIKHYFFNNAGQFVITVGGAAVVSPILVPIRKR